MTVAHTFLLKAALVLFDVLLDVGDGVVLSWCNELVDSDVGGSGEVSYAVPD